MAKKRSSVNPTYPPVSMHSTQVTELREDNPWDLTWRADILPDGFLPRMSMTMGVTTPPRLGWCKVHKKVARLPNDHDTITICGLHLKRDTKLPKGIVWSSGLMCDQTLQPWDELMAALIITGDDKELRDRTAWDMIHDRQRAEYIASSWHWAPAPGERLATVDDLKAKFRKR